MIIEMISKNREMDTVEINDYYGGERMDTLSTILREADLKNDSFPKMMEELHASSEAELLEMIFDADLLDNRSERKEIFRTRDFYKEFDSASNIEGILTYVPRLGFVNEVFFLYQEDDPYSAPEPVFCIRSMNYGRSAEEIKNCLFRTVTEVRNIFKDFDFIKTDGK